MSNAKIKAVAPSSIAEEIGLCPGDCILKINQTKIEDVLDYKFLSCDEELEIEYITARGRHEIAEVYTGYEDLGIEFENSLLDAPKRCKNKCIFCFIDQLPKGMRETVYFKDDDARLSFLQGNYITLTNLSGRDIDRIIKMRISPVNVSVHTTDPELRKMMLGNRHAGAVYETMCRLAQNKISMNCQIVACPGINDGATLDKTISDLSKLFPYVNSVSVVPVGLTAHREGLYPLKSYNKKTAAQLVNQIHGWQKKLKESFGSALIYASDEFYLMADILLPPEEAYEGYPQIENGVGLIKSMETEFEQAFGSLPQIKINRKVSIATGELAYPFIKNLAQRLTEHTDGFCADVYPIKNNFFGGGVTVSGLVCAGDIIKHLQGKDLGCELLIPASMLRADDDVFLDDISLSELEKTLNVTVTPVLNDGYDFIEKLLNIQLHTGGQHTWQNR